MREADLPLAEDIAEQVHPDHPEDPAVFAERLVLYPNGCRVLEMDLCPVGYMIAHPWRLENPPKLNTLLRRLPVGSDTFFIHDLALLPGARGHGDAAAAVAGAIAEARRLSIRTVSLISVGVSGGFWRGQGFEPSPDAAIQRGLGTYGAGAVFMVRTLGCQKRA